MTKETIYSEVYKGNGPAHLLSVKESKTEKKNISKTRDSKAFNTKSLVIINFYKPTI